MRFFGEVSYSWYLWHWPVSVLFTYFEANITTPINLLIYLTVPLGLATLSTYMMEKPLIRIQHGKVETVLTAIIPPLLFLFATSLFLFTGRMDTVSPQMNQTSRYNPNDPEILRLHHKWYDCYFTNLCTLGNATSNRTTFIWGDSHGECCTLMD